MGLKGHAAAAVPGLAAAPKASSASPGPSSSPGRRGICTPALRLPGAREAGRGGPSAGPAHFSFCSACSVVCLLMSSVLKEQKHAEAAKSSKRFLFPFSKEKATQKLGSPDGRAAPWSSLGVRPRCREGQWGVCGRGSGVCGSWPCTLVGPRGSRERPGRSELTAPQPAACGLMPTSSFLRTICSKAERGGERQDSSAKVAFMSWREVASRAPGELCPG